VSGTGDAHGSDVAPFARRAKCDITDQGQHLTLLVDLDPLVVLGR